MKELLDQLRALTDIEGIGDLADQISGAWDELSAGSAASIAEKDTSIADLQAQVQKLQAENYKLLTANGETESGDDNPPDNDGEDYGETLDDLDYIEKKEED